MTPHELNMMIHEWSAGQRREERLLHESAYLGAYYHRVKKFPTHDKVFGDAKTDQPKKKNQTAAEMFAEVIKLNAALGGKQE